jgi:hypothetical protein
MNHTGMLQIAALITLASQAAVAAGPPGSLDVNVINAPDVIVKNTPTVNVNSSVQNPVIVQEVSPAATPNLVRDTLPSSSSEITLEVPPRRVITDILIEVFEFNDPEQLCLLQIVDASDGFSFVYVVEESFTHIALNSGLDSGTDGMQLHRFIAGSACLYDLAYTGYEY